MQASLSRKICLAPMLDWTDRHFRYLIRLLSPHTLLYTEMITTGAILFGDTHRHLIFNTQEHPVALQLGGSDPQALAKCARIAQRYGYDEVNLNVGCPSNRVQSGRFGACLMREPELVAQCVQAMREVVDIPVTVKSRIGVDEHEEYSVLRDFVSTVAQTGCETFIVHARKAWLKGLSPKQNRDIPPLRYEFVYQLKQDFPELEIIINGGIKTLSSVQAHLQSTDGVMLGRIAAQEPYFFAMLEREIFAQDALDREQIVKKYSEYVCEQHKSGIKLSALVRPIVNLFNGLPNAKRWRRYLSTKAHLPSTPATVLLDALEQMHLD